MFSKVILCGAIACVSMLAQSPDAAKPDLKARAEEAAKSGTYRVESGTHILLTMRNSVSTKSAAVGDKLYLVTSFPILVNGRVVIPEGSYVTGTITEFKRAGRVKGKSEMQVRFDSLILPNGVSRGFKSDLGAVDGRSNEGIDREHSKVKGDSSKGEDARTIATTTATGAGIGTLAGVGAGRWARGLGVGSAAGAAAGVATVLLTRGPDASLSQGSTVEMVTDRPLDFEESELAKNTTTIQRMNDTPSDSNSQQSGGFKPVRQ